MRGIYHPTGVRIMTGGYMDFNDFWSGLSVLNRTLFVAAAFFSVFFLWHMVSAFVGLGDADGDNDGLSTDSDSPDHSLDTHESMFLFKMVSLRSVLAFATLFCWTSALYMSIGNMPTTRALLLGLAWGAAAMASVALILELMRKMTHSANIRPSDARSTPRP
jgi:hypothetical protein